MPRSIQEILDHGDELARRFEDYEPNPDDERPVEEYLLERAAIARAQGERQVVDAVVVARSKGVSWQRIGDILGTSAQAAQQRYGIVVESAGEALDRASKPGPFTADTGPTPENLSPATPSPPRASAGNGERREPCRLSSVALSLEQLPHAQVVEHPSTNPVEG